MTLNQVLKNKMSAERKRLQNQPDEDVPDRKFRALDSIYMFDAVDISVIIDDNNNVWFRGIDLARALEIEDPSNAIYKAIDKKYCQNYETLSSSMLKYQNIPSLHPKTTFVNETGMNLFIMRSRKPKAEAFTQWVCGVVLPSIRKTNKYEIDPVDNPYREISEMLKKQVEDQRNRISGLENDKSNLITEKSILTDENKILHNDVRKYFQTLLEMKPSCVPTLENQVKQEYFVVYRKYRIDDDSSSSSSIDSLYPMPYYACRVQLDSLEQRRQELLVDYPDLVKLLQLAVPNSVIFFNYVLEQMSDYIERETKGQSFRIHILDENQMLAGIKNLHRTLHGEV